jgi:hypothetical protein
VKQRFPDSGKAYCVLKRKAAKMQFLSKNDPFWSKNVQERKSVVFGPKYVILYSFFESEEFLNVKFGFSAHFYPKRGRFKAKITSLRLFASIHNTPSMNQKSVFSLRKCQIRIPRMFLPLERSFPEKIFT